MDTFKAPFYPKHKVWEKVEEFRTLHPRACEIPVPIDKLIEFDLNLEIIPIPGLRSTWDIDALLFGDLSGIEIDRDIFINELFPYRYRFSLAHELGHLILHGEIYRKHKFSDIKGWKDFISAIPDQEYSYMEFQAYEFAGRLLVQRDALKEEYDKNLDLVSNLEASSETNIEDNYLADYISIPIAKRFCVSQEVIQKRLRSEDLLQF